MDASLGLNSSSFLPPPQAGQVGDSFAPVQINSNPKPATATAIADQTDFKQKQELLAQILEMQGQIDGWIQDAQPSDLASLVNCGINKLTGNKRVKVWEGLFEQLDQLSSQLAVGKISVSEARMQFRKILKENNLNFEKAVEAEAGVFENLAFGTKQIETLSETGTQLILSRMLGAEMGFIGSGVFRIINSGLKKASLIASERGQPIVSKTILIETLKEIMAGEEWKQDFQETTQLYLTQKLGQNIPPKLGKIISSGAIYAGSDTISQVLSNLMEGKQPFESFDKDSVFISLICGLVGGVLGIKLEKAQLGEFPQILVEAGYDGIAGLVQEMILARRDGRTLDFKQGLEIFIQEFGGEIAGVHSAQSHNKAKQAPVHQEGQIWNTKGEVIGHTNGSDFKVVDKPTENINPSKVTVDVKAEPMPEEKNNIVPFKVKQKPEIKPKEETQAKNNIVETATLREIQVRKKAEQAFGEIQAYLRYLPENSRNEIKTILEKNGLVTQENKALVDEWLNLIHRGQAKLKQLQKILNLESIKPDSLASIHVEMKINDEKPQVEVPENTLASVDENKENTIKPEIVFLNEYNGWKIQTREDGNPVLKLVHLLKGQPTERFVRPFSTLEYTKEFPNGHKISIWLPANISDWGMISIKGKDGKAQTQRPSEETIKELSKKLLEQIDNSLANIPDSEKCFLKVLAISPFPVNLKRYRGGRICADRTLVENSNIKTNAVVKFFVGSELSLAEGISNNHYLKYWIMPNLIHEIGHIRDYANGNSQNINQVIEPNDVYKSDSSFEDFRIRRTEYLNYTKQHYIINALRVDMRYRQTIKEGTLLSVRSIMETAIRGSKSLKSQDEIDNFLLSWKKQMVAIIPRNTLSNHSRLAYEQKFAKLRGILDNTRLGKTPEDKALEMSQELINELWEQVDFLGITNYGSTKPREAIAEAYNYYWRAKSASKNGDNKSLHWLKTLYPVTFNLFEEEFNNTNKTQDLQPPTQREGISSNSRIKINKVLGDKRKYLVTSLNEEINQGKFPTEKAVIIGEDGNIISQAQGQEVNVPAFGNLDNLSLEEIENRFASAKRSIFMHSHPIPSPLSTEDIINHLPQDHESIEAHLANGGFSILKRPTEGWEKALVNFRDSNPQLEQRIRNLGTGELKAIGSDFNQKSMETLQYISFYMKAEYEAILKQISQQYQAGQYTEAEAFSEMDKRWDQVIRGWAKKLKAEYSSSGIGDTKEIQKLKETEYFKDLVFATLRGERAELIKKPFLAEYGAGDYDGIDFKSMADLGDFYSEVNKFIKGVSGSSNAIHQLMQSLNSNDLVNCQDYLKQVYQDFDPSSLAYQRANHILSMIDNILSTPQTNPQDPQPPAQSQPINSNSKDLDIQTSDNAEFKPVSPKEEVVSVHSETREYQVNIQGSANKIIKISDSKNPRNKVEFILNKSGVVVINIIHVSTEDRGQGISKQLLEVLKKEVETRGAKTIVVDVTNPIALMSFQSVFANYPFSKSPETMNIELQEHGVTDFQIFLNIPQTNPQNPKPPAQNKEINSIRSDLDIQNNLGSGTRFVIDHYTQDEINTNHNYEVESKKVVKQAVDLIQAGKSYKEVLDFLAIERGALAGNSEFFGKERIRDGFTPMVNKYTGYVNKLISICVPTEIDFFSDESLYVEDILFPENHLSNLIEQDFIQLAIMKNIDSPLKINLTNETIQYIQNLIKQNPRMQRRIFRIKENINNENFQLTYISNIPYMMGSPYSNETREFTILHTAPRHFPLIHSKLETIHNEILQNTDTKQTINKLAEFYWWMSQACFFERGSAAISDWYLDALAKTKGINIIGWKDGLDPNLEAILSPKEEFIKNFTNLGQIESIALNELTEQFKETPFTSTSAQTYIKAYEEALSAGLSITDKQTELYYKAINTLNFDDAKDLLPNYLTDEEIQKTQSQINKQSPIEGIQANLGEAVKNYVAESIFDDPSQLVNLTPSQSIVYISNCFLEIVKSLEYYIQNTDGLLGILGYSDILNKLSIKAFERFNTIFMHTHTRNRDEAIHKEISKIVEKDFSTLQVVWEALKKRDLSTALNTLVFWLDSEDIQVPNQEINSINTTAPTRTLADFSQQAKANLDETKAKLAQKFAEKTGISLEQARKQIDNSNVQMSFIPSDEINALYQEPPVIIAKLPELTPEQKLVAAKLLLALVVNFNGLTAGGWIFPSLKALHKEPDTAKPEKVFPKNNSEAGYFRLGELNPHIPPLIEAVLKLSVLGKNQNKLYFPTFEKIKSELTKKISQIKTLNNKPMLIQVGVENIMTLESRTNNLLKILPTTFQKEAWNSIVERLVIGDAYTNKIFLPAIQELHNEIILNSISDEKLNESSNLVYKFEQLLNKLVKDNPQFNSSIDRTAINIERKFYSQKIFEFVNGKKTNIFDKGKIALFASLHKMTYSLRSYTGELLKKLLSHDYTKIPYLRELPIKRIQSVKDGLEILSANHDDRLSKIFSAYLENYIRNLDSKEFQMSDFKAQVLSPVIQEFFKQINHFENAKYNLSEVWDAISKIHFGFTGEELNLKKLWTYLPISMQEQLLVHTINVPVSSIIYLTFGPFPSLFSSVLLPLIIRDTFRNNSLEHNPFPSKIGEKFQKDALTNTTSLLLTSVTDIINSQLQLAGSILPVIPVIKGLTSFGVSSILDERKFLISETALKLLIDEGLTEAQIIEIFREANNPLKFNLLAKLQVAGLSPEEATALVSVIQKTVLGLATRKKSLKQSFLLLWQAHQDAIKLKERIISHLDSQKAQKLFNELNDYLVEAINIRPLAK